MTTITRQEMVAAPELRERGVWAQAFGRFRRHRVAMVGVVLLALIALSAIAAPLLTPYSPDQTNLIQRLRPPSPEHPFGTDDLGRDVLTRVLYGGRVSLSIGLLAMSVAITIGTLLGALSGFYGGWIDNVIMRVADTMIALPRLFVLILIAALIGTRLETLVLILGVFAWMHVSRLVRASFLSLKEREFVEAARSVGAGNPRIILRHVLPNAVGPIIVAATLGVAGAIITESSLSFLGLGVQPPTATWGNMLRAAQSQLRQAPWNAIFPGLMIFAAVLSINFIGDGLRDALDPRRA